MDDISLADLKSWEILNSNIRVSCTLRIPDLFYRRVQAGGSWTFFREWRDEDNEEIDMCYKFTRVVPPPSPTSVATGIFQLSPQTTTRIVPDDVLSPCSWTSSVNLTISNSASSSLVNLTYLPNLIQEDVPTIIALRFPRLRKRRLTYKRSCCGLYWHIIDTSLPPVYLPRTRASSRIEDQASSPSSHNELPLPLSEVEGESLDSSARMKTCQSPIRGHDPG